MNDKKVDLGNLSELFKQEGLNIFRRLLRLIPEGAEDGILDISKIELEEPEEGEIFLVDLELPEQILYALAQNAHQKHQQLLDSINHIYVCDECAAKHKIDLPEEIKKIARKTVILANRYKDISNILVSLFETQICLRSHMGNLVIPEKLVGKVHQRIVRKGFKLYAKELDIGMPLFLIGTAPEDSSYIVDYEEGETSPDFNDMREQAEKDGLDVEIDPKFSGNC